MMKEFIKGFSEFFKLLRLWFLELWSQFLPVLKALDACHQCYPYNGFYQLASFKKFIKTDKAEVRCVSHKWGFGRVARDF